MKKNYVIIPIQISIKSFYEELTFTFENTLAALAQMVACLSLVQQVLGSILGGGSKFSFENFQHRG